MSEQLKEQAVLHALGILEPGEAKLFEQKLASDPSLRALKQECESTVVELGRLVTPSQPPADLKERVMAEIQTRSQHKRLSIFPTAAILTGARWMVRGIAAALAVGAVWLWSERQHLTSRMAEVEQAASRVASENEEKSRRAQELESALKLAESRVSDLSGEIDGLRKQDALARMQIAMLQSSVSQYKQGVAVVVWDSEKHTGILKLEKMPPLDSKKDYQLWVVDPKNPAPVNAGVVQVDSRGFAKIDFKPVDAVSEASKFALSVERKGGVPKGEGPIVFIGGSK